MSHEETRRAVELENYFSVIPAFSGIYKDIQYSYDDLVSASVTNPYVSNDENCLSNEQLKSFLLSNKLLDMTRFQPDHPNERYWPGDEKVKN